MLWKSKFVLAFFLLLLPCSLATGFSQVPKKLAVLHFENNADPQYANFVRGLPSMLMTTLARSPDIILVERFTQQPKIFQVEIKPGATALIKYEFHTGWRKDEYKYYE